MRTCYVCKEEKELTEFSKDKHSKGGGYTYSCKECRRKKNKEWREANPEKVKQKNAKNAAKRKEYYQSDTGIRSSRNCHLKRMYGITLEQYEAMSEAQDHKCDICGNPEMNNKNKVLCVDHNHNTGEIRGLLCGNCNVGIGNLQDNIELLKKSIIYLKKFKNE